MIVAAFDFDHTLITGDSMRAFLRYHVGEYKFWKGVALHGPLLSAFYARMYDRKRTKEILLKHYLAGQSINQLTQSAESFSAEILPSMIRPEALQKLKWHQKKGHQCLLVTASLSIWTAPIARQLSLPLIATLPEVQNGVFTGGIQGPNNYGREKVRRILNHLNGKKIEEAYGYGDSRGDQEMLAWADHSFYRRFN